MAEIRTVTTLTAKRDAVERAIKGYEAALAQAHVDLAAINATIACFQREGEEAPVTPYFDLHRHFKRGEMVKIAMGAIAKEGPLSTTDIARRIVTAKGFDEGDRVLRKAIGFPPFTRCGSLRRRASLRTAESVAACACGRLGDTSRAVCLFD